MPEFHIGRYKYDNSMSNPKIYIISSRQSAVDSDMDDRIKRYDHVLHQSLDKIFCKRRRSISDKIKRFLCGPKRNNQRSIIKPILKQEPVLSEHFSKEELKKLSLLWISVLAGYEKSAELLVRSGADVNEPFGRHDPQVIGETWTILHVLLQMRCGMDPSPENELLTRLVIDYGADLQARDTWGRSVLLYAVREGQVQMIEMLLEKGADVNAADNDGMTALLGAAGKSKANVILPLLIKHGADVSAKSKNGENVLHRLLGYVHPQLHTAELARVFIEKGVSLDDRAKTRQPIHLAALWGNNELVKLFLDHGANVNAQTCNGIFPLYYASKRENNSAMLETLLRYGANVNQTCTTNGNSLGSTALHAACYNFREENIRLLLSAGADVLIENYNGKTPFAILLSENRENSSSVRLIIEVLALKKVVQPTIELKDENLIRTYPILWKHYRDCIEQIEKRMKSTRFIETCTFYELLTKSQCQIAALMRNPNFETKFRMYDLSGFSVHYAKVITRAFERTQDHYYSMLEQKEVINEAVYYILPDLVVDKVVHRIFNCCKSVK